MSRLNRLIVGILLCAAPACAQQGGNAPVNNDTRQITVQLADPPQKVQSATVRSVGFGPATYFYWLVTNATAGNSSPAGPFPAYAAPNTLNSGTYNTINWPAANGAVTYDVLRTSSTAIPTGACNCAVATAQTGLSVNDQSNSLNSYTVNTMATGTLDVVIANKSLSTGASHLTFSTIGGLLLFDLDVPSGAISPNGLWVNGGNYPTVAGAVAALPNGGGTILYPLGTANLTGGGTIPSNSRVMCMGPGSTTLNFTGSGYAAFNLAGNNHIEIDHCGMVSQSGALYQFVKGTNGSGDIKIHDNHVTGSVAGDVADSLTSGFVVCEQACTDWHVYENKIEALGKSTSLTGPNDVIAIDFEQVDTNVPTRINIHNNSILMGTPSNIGIACFNCTYSDIKDNLVDEGNQCYLTTGVCTNNGYGIVIYQAGGAAAWTQDQISGNTVRNTAGSGIYAIGTTGASDLVVLGNTLYNVDQQQPDNNAQVGGIAVGSSAAQTNMTNVSIVGNLIDNVGAGGGDGITCNVTTDCLIANNVINNIQSSGGLGGTGIWFRGTATVRPIAIGNKVTAATLYGILVDGVASGANAGGELGGNTLTGPGTGSTTGINVNNFPSGSIHDNTFKAWTNNDILVGGSSTDLDVHDNKDATCPAGGVGINANTTSASRSHYHHNNFIGCDIGIEDSSNNDTIEYNHLINAVADALIEGGNNNQITNNWLYGAGTAAVSNTGTGNTLLWNRYTQTGAIKGRSVLVGGTVTVSDVEVVASDFIQITNCTNGGTLGTLSVGTITAGTSFVLNSSSGSDTSTVCWTIPH